jgi:hypothetical protein
MPKRSRVEMSKKPKGLNRRAIKEQVTQIKKHRAQNARRGVFLLSTLLITICLVLVFRIGESGWPVWMLTHRMQIVALLVLSIIMTILSSPLVIEVNSNPRPLSGSESSDVPFDPD